MRGTPFSICSRFIDRLLHPLTTTTPFHPIEKMGGYKCNTHCHHLPPSDVSRHVRADRRLHQQFVSTQSGLNRPESIEREQSRFYLMGLVWPRLEPAMHSYAIRIEPPDWTGTSRFYSLFQRKPIEHVHFILVTLLSQIAINKKIGMLRSWNSCGSRWIGSWCRPCWNSCVHFLLVRTPQSLGGRRQMELENDEPSRFISLFSPFPFRKSNPVSGCT